MATIRSGKHLNRQRTRALLAHITIGASPWWLGVCLPLAIYLLFGLGWCGTEQQWRYAGLTMQLAGIYLVVDGLVKTLQRFKEPTPTAALRKWFVTLKTLILPPAPINATLNVSLSAVLSATGSVKATLSSDPLTAEQRIAALETALRDVDTRVRTLETEVPAKHRALEASVAVESAERSRQDALLHSLIKEQVASDMHISITGLLWLIGGTIAGTVSAELSAHLALWRCW